MSRPDPGAAAAADGRAVRLTAGRIERSYLYSGEEWEVDGRIEHAGRSWTFTYTLRDEGPGDGSTEELRIAPSGGGQEVRWEYGADSPLGPGAGWDWLAGTIRETFLQPCWDAAWEADRAARGRLLAAPTAVLLPAADRPVPRPAATAGRSAAAAGRGAGR